MYEITRIVKIIVGCGRSGNFFSFERAGIVPDMVTLSKSISGSGLPMSLLLLKAEIDLFQPGEHNGTFRGNQLAFVGAKAAIEYFMKHELWNQVREKERILQEYLDNNICFIHEKIKYRGIGMIYGIDFSEFNTIGIGEKIMEECFQHKLIIETAGRNHSVIKILPPLIIPNDDLINGLNIIKNAIETVLTQNEILNK